MNNSIFPVFILILLFCSGSVQAQTKKFDTMGKMGNEGYRVENSNNFPDIFLMPNCGKDIKVR